MWSNVTEKRPKPHPHTHTAIFLVSSMEGTFIQLSCISKGTFYPLPFGLTFKIARDINVSRDHGTMHVSGPESSKKCSLLCNFPFEYSSMHE